MDPLSPHPPYDFDKLLDLLRRYAYPTLDRVHGAAYRRVFRVEDQLALVEVISEGTVEKPLLRAHILARTGDFQESLLREKIRHVLAIESPDRAAFFRMAQRHDTLHAVVGSLYGLPLLHTEDSFEALVITLIEQQIAWKAALRAQRWLVEWAGQTIEYGGETYYGFPTPRQLADSSVDDLKLLKITFRRMEFLIQIAQKIAGGDLNLAGLSAQEAYQTLLKIKGIGHWTAAVTLSRAFGFRQHLAHNDAALQAAVNRYFYGQTGRASPQALIDAFSPYDGFAGDAALYTLLRWVFDEYPP